MKLIFANVKKNPGALQIVSNDNFIFSLHDQYPMEDFNGLDKSIETSLRLLSLTIRHEESGNGTTADAHSEDLELTAEYIRDEMVKFKGHRHDARMAVLLRLESFIYAVIDAHGKKNKTRALESLKQEMKRSETEANALKELNGTFYSEPNPSKSCRGFTGPVEVLLAKQEQRKTGREKKLPYS